jgi:hypothetical protein
MGMTMTVSLPTEKTNAAIKDGTLMSAIQSMLTDLKPEAAYFSTDNDGRRFAIVVFETTHASEMPKLAEPWFLGFNAEVTFRPVMNPEDLAYADLVASSRLWPY